MLSNNEVANTKLTKLIKAINNDDNTNKKM